ncbi:UvrD-helicase domain-containing protein [Aquibacillus salsiterrae]|uniref:DNA 3'-5' helicase n=1 Tax=Aquibacillus salsiterrae TaxID=2950439 RepID=A0A9X4AFX4_9BACI|nr:UvrD-helicase domain-containing protein [Aquibacillus salsiterrae]MDC3418361.1 exodeoxyribonuclease V subunit gamma [Aquibacillus salsiterrae]
MSLSKLSPYELGETNDVGAIDYLINYLKEGDDNEKRLAASAINKLSKAHPNECIKSLPYLLNNVTSTKPQLRQYALKAINVLISVQEEVTLSSSDQQLIEQIAIHDEKEYNQKIAQAVLCYLQKRLVKLEVDQAPTSRNRQGEYYPQGATKKVVEQAELATNQTTVELVNEADSDSFYFRELEGKGIKLNQSQLLATRHLKGPALVLAGAGSGKTRVLSSRAGYLMSVYNVNPKNILLLTFTRKAAKEMEGRIASLPGLSKSVVRDVTSGTLHSIFLKILKWQGDGREIISSEKQKRTYLKMIMKDMSLSDDYEPEVLLALLSYQKSNMVTVVDFPEQTPVEKEIKVILKKYEDMKRINNYMDYDDILLDSYFLLKNNKTLLQSLQKRFSFILCDEWQDTNPVQYELIKMLAMPQNNLFVVGDDDQTIYEFNGADASIILNFNKEFPHARTYTLDTNYRSTTSIVGLANKVISFNKHRYKKTLKATRESDDFPLFLRPNNTDEEAELILDNIISEVKQGKRKYQDFAVLYRTNSNSRAILDQCLLNDIPYITFGNSSTFYEQGIVKPVLDHLRLTINEKDTKAARGVTPTLYMNREKATDFMLRQEAINPKKSLLTHLIDYPGLKDFQKEQISQRINLIRQMKPMKPVKAVKRIHAVYSKFLLANERKNITLHKEIVQETLSELEAAATRFSTIAEFIEFVEDIIEKNNQMEELRKNPQADAVNLMTIHMSKGLEFPVVYLIGASENILPHSSVLDAENRKDLVIMKRDKNQTAIEGERRLLYVAVTRAEQELYISSPAIYRDKKIAISRFIRQVFAQPFKPKPVAKTTSMDKQKIKTNHVTYKTETILVWDCTSKKCNGWVRIASYEETLVETKECPICGEAMKKGPKEVRTRGNG